MYGAFAWRAGRLTAQNGGFRPGQTAASGGGKQCEKTNGQAESGSCNTAACPVDCEGGWGYWGACDRACGGGQKVRSYAITQEATGVGAATCEHDNGETESASCNPHVCRVDCQGSWSDWSSVTPEMCLNSATPNTNYPEYDIAPNNFFTDSACGCMALCSGKPDAVAYSWVGPTAYSGGASLPPSLPPSLSPSY